MMKTSVARFGGGFGSFATFPWRHQLEALAKEGFRAIAPDMCG
jgi:hypothetical protein